MNMFARFDENQAMTLEDIKETKHYRRTHAPTTRKQYTHHKQSLRGGGGGGGGGGEYQIVPSKAVVGVDRPMYGL